MSPINAAEDPHNSPMLFVSMSIVFIAVTVTGFGPTFFFSAFSDSPALPFRHMLHGVIFTSWYALFFVQSLAIYQSNFRLHKLLGYCGVFLAFAIIINAAVMVVYFTNDFQPTGNPGDLIFKATGVWANFHLALSYVLFVSLALAYRLQPHLHQRFMLLASIGMMTASVTRIGTSGVVPIHAGTFTFIGMFILLMTPICYEYVTYKKVHPIYKWGAAGYFVTLILFAAVMPFTSVGQAAVFLFK